MSLNQSEGQLRIQDGAIVNFADNLEGSRAILDYCNQGCPFINICPHTIVNHRLDLTPIFNGAHNNGELCALYNRQNHTSVVPGQFGIRFITASFIAKNARCPVSSTYQKQAPGSSRTAIVEPSTDYPSWIDRKDM